MLTARILFLLQKHFLGNMKHKSIILDFFYLKHGHTSQHTAELQTKIHLLKETFTSKRFRLNRPAEPLTPNQIRKFEVKGGTPLGSLERILKQIIKKWKKN